LDRAAVRVDEAETALERRRLAGAVRTEQCEAFAAADGERQSAHDLELAVALAQRLHAQHRRVVLRARPRRRDLRDRVVHWRLAWPPRGYIAVTTLASCGSRPWKKWPQPGKTTTGNCCGRAQPSTSASGTTSSSSPCTTTVPACTWCRGKRLTAGPTRSRPSACPRSATRVCTNEPNENPASATGSASPNRLRTCARTASASSVSPMPSSNVPADLPTPRKLRRAAATRRLSHAPDR